MSERLENIAKFSDIEAEREGFDSSRSIFLSTCERRLFRERKPGGRSIVVGRFPVRHIVLGAFDQDESVGLNRRQAAFSHQLRQLLRGLEAIFEVEIIQRQIDVDEQQLLLQLGIIQRRLVAPAGRVRLPPVPSATQLCYFSRRPHI
jgi:hypothetical protein